MVTLIFEVPVGVVGRVGFPPVKVFWVEGPQGSLATQVVGHEVPVASQTGGASFQEIFPHGRVKTPPPNRPSLDLEANL